MKRWSQILKQFALVSQLGLSLIMPTLLCLLACMLLTTYAGVGAWIYIPGFILGLGSSFMTAYKFYQAVIRKEEAAGRKDKDKISFNSHK